MNDTTYPCTGRWKEFTGEIVYRPGMAAAMCFGCPIVYACLMKALRSEGRDPASSRAGVWGGTTPKQRYQIAMRGTGHPDAHQLQHLARSEDPADCARCTPAAPVAA